ncbi:helix-turn-helix domain-containing protein [Oxalobacter vibrioformis]|uniref:Helix-turn-helix domain-containing protein n=1 Tax=Oxalobacter vibrioformis TaxID=933080 RepID=A0A9E9LY74_9BURK|nr:helix-turn-helix domain-containing protein [Oxalobacter vibrioformis]NLC24595.1 helix-turn-helix transcriptional regulator [Oxalobacter sp.]WAW09745.1 helix-turn-helix domain-containing protein [Oxalobacter vibrioformis]WAW10073.1 helix-turn-helix domain-containing protein [Oxalobacter vibrioformis]
MDTKQATTTFEALSSDVRLDIFRLLVKHAPDGLVAGEIAKALDIPSTNLSFHLKGITHSGLVNMEKEGRYLRYRANIPLMLELIGYLTEECCSADPEKCMSYRADCGIPAGFLPDPAAKKKK